MQRPIKFRAWDKTQKKWAGMREAGVLHGLHYFEVRESEVEVMQFTGLLDKQGKEIYEGDIVQWNVPHGAKAEVKFGKWDNGERYEAHEFGYGWYLETYYQVRTTWRIRQGHLWDDPIYRADNAGNNNQVEVIGNIHENKELLK